MMNVSEALAIGNKNLNGAMGERRYLAESELKSARELADGGFNKWAMAYLVNSLKYSVGLDHPDYLEAKEFYESIPLFT